VGTSPPEAEVTVDQDSTRQAAESFREASKDTLVERMGIAILEASAERVVGTMPVEGNCQPYGLLHGGASCVLAETLGSLGSALHAGPDRFTVGIEISATHHRAVSSGTVTGVATLLHGGRSVTTYEIVISDEAGRRVCTSRLTCLLTDRVPGRGSRPPSGPVGLPGAADGESGGADGGPAITVGEPPHA
jgi:1,4-dihydroxy-2-naphthoyl-CoA hydrolase